MCETFIPPHSTSHSDKHFSGSSGIPLMLSFAILYYHTFTLYFLSALYYEGALLKMIKSRHDIFFNKKSQLYDKKMYMNYVFWENN